MKWIMYRAVALLTCVGIWGCNGEAIQAAQGAHDSAAAFKVDVQKTKDTADAQFATTSATQPSYQTLKATTQKLDDINRVAEKALEVTDQALKAAQAKSIDDPEVVKTAQLAIGAIPSPYTPIAIALTPLVLGAVASAIQAFKHGKSSGALEATQVHLENAQAAHVDAQETITSLQADLLSAKASLAAAGVTSSNPVGGK